MTKHPIVVLHGWGLNQKRFKPLTDELSGMGYRVYCPDMPGFGEADIPAKAMTLTDYAGFIDSYLKKYRITDPVLVCHSFGGRVALNYLANHPEAASAVVFTGTPGFSPVRKAKFAVFVGIAKLGNAAMSLPFLSGWKDTVRKWYYYMVGARDFYRANGVMRDTFKLVVQEDLGKYMQGLRIPVLLVWGETDRIVPLAIARRMETAIPGARLTVMAGHDHSVPFSAPRDFARIVDGFVQTV
jgi:pimeloyl-ACP methyl ester carboxylesterase